MGLRRERFASIREVNEVNINFPLLCLFFVDITSNHQSFLHCLCYTAIVRTAVLSERGCAGVKNDTEHHALLSSSPSVCVMPPTAAASGHPKFILRHFYIWLRDMFIQKATILCAV